MTNNYDNKISAKKVQINNYLLISDYQIIQTDLLFFINCVYFMFYLLISLIKHADKFIKYISLSSIADASSLNIKGLLNRQ